MLKAATNLELLSAEEKAEAIESDFLLGTQEKSAREWFPVFQAGGAAGSPDLYAMKGGTTKRI